MTDQEIRDQILQNNARLVGNKIATAGAHSNIDSFYGPYKDVEQALLFTDKVKAVGLTVGIYKENHNEITEYWYKKSTNTPSGWELVEKSDNYELRIDSITHTSDTINNKITFNIKASGKGFKVQTTIYLGSVKLADVNTILNSEDGQNIVVNAPDNPGNYTYTISLVDSVLGNGAQTTYTVIWKEIDIKIDQNSTIYRYKVKSFQNLQEAEFSFQIYKIDQVDITQTKVCFGSDTSTARGFITCSNESYQNIQISSLVSEGLESGDKIWINVIGTRSDTGQTIEAPIVEVVQLTAPGIFSNIEGTIPDVVYNGLTFSVTLKFEAETNGNYKVVIKDGSTEVYNSSLLAYTTNTLALRLNDPGLSPYNQTSYHILKVYIGDSEKIKEDYTFDQVILKYVSQEEQLKDVSGQNGFKFSNKLRFITQGDGVTLTSYMLDMVCYIPYTETVTNVFKFGDITINREVISLGSSISYPTPLQQTVTIGIMRNVMSTYTYTDKTYYYDAIFINGVLCGKWPNVGNVNIPSNTLITPSSDITDTISSKIRLYYNVSNPINQDPESYVLEKNYIARNPRSEDNTSVPTFVITPLPNIITKANLRDLGYNDSQIESFSDSSITVGSGSEAITYQVIDNTTYKVGKFGSLGQEKYKLNSLISDFCRAYDVDNSQQQGESENARQDRLLDELKSKVKADPSKIPSTYLSLTSQIVKSKNLLQKYVKVPCSWSYIDSTGTEHSGYLLASSQGTSTLEFALPNFTFAFYTSQQFSTKASVSLIPKIIRTLDNMLDYSTEINKNTQYYTDKELVAKADYMESSHLNNTPTAMYYNAITTQQDGYYALDKNGNQIVDSSVVVPPGGTPEYIKILENPNSNKLNAIEGMPVVLEIGGTNYGSFMLNLGKKASAIGFGSNGISLEGTSNDDNSGMSSRFDFAAGDTKALQYFNTISDISDIDNISEVNTDFAKFIRGGLEYRYSAADLDDIGKDIVETTIVDGQEQTNVISALPEFKRIFKMWYWVYTNQTYNRQKFEEMFNFEYAALYYIQMMIFGQTDNLGKNCMFDQFDTNGQWYVRPYDMDSQAGLNNGGIDELSPVIEISKEFVLDQDTKDITTVRYGGKSTERFPYSSKTSNLWIRFYRNLKDEIEIFYEYLRNLGYSAESVISLCKKEVIDKLKIHQYNIDFRNKYLSNTDVGQQFAYGNRWVKFQDWIKTRFDFCDTYFGYSKYETNTKTRSTPYTITYSLPWYTIYSYNDAHATYTTSNWGYTCNLLFQSITNQTMIFSPEYIVDDDGIFYSGFSRVIPRVKLNNLISYNGSWDNLSNVVDLSENTYMKEMTVDSISVGGNGCIPTSVQTLTITNSSGIPQLNNYTNLKTLNLSNCEGDIYLNNCPMLQTISIDGCKQINFTLIDCGSSTQFVDIALNNTTFNQIVLNGCYINYLNLKSKKLNISFTGSETYIKTLRLDEATILNRELDITNLKVDNFILNSITSVKVITRTQKSYNFLGLLRGAILQWGNTENTFDGSCFANINSIRMIESITDTVISNLLNNTYNSSIKFRLMHCTEIQNVENLDVSTDNNLFYNCNKLVSITNRI